VWASELLARQWRRRQKERGQVSLLSGSAISCFESKIDRAEGQGFPKLVEPRFFVQVRQTEVENDHCCDTAEVGPAMGARVGEKGIDSVDWRDEDGTSGRSWLLCALRLRLSQIRCSSLGFCKYIGGSTAGTTSLQTRHYTQILVLQSLDAHAMTPTRKRCCPYSGAH
jgi:hypothetical protein